jgi:hypothetical protein
MKMNIIPRRLTEAEPYFESANSGNNSEGDEEQ